MFYTYVIKSKKDKKYYTGTTANLRKRFQEHSDNKVVSTKNRGPFELIYYEACVDMNDAFARERYLKTGMGKRYLKNRLKRFLSVTGQVTLELCFTIILTVILFLVTGYLFFWLNSTLANRQEKYESDKDYGRVAAGSVANKKTEVQVDESGNLELNFFEMGLE